MSTYIVEVALCDLVVAGSALSISFEYTNYTIVTRQARTLDDIAIATTALVQPFLPMVMMTMQAGNKHDCSECNFVTTISHKPLQCFEIVRCIPCRYTTHTTKGRVFMMLRYFEGIKLKLLTSKVFSNLYHINSNNYFSHRLCAVVFLNYL